MDGWSLSRGPEDGSGWKVLEKPTGSILQALIAVVVNAIRVICREGLSGLACVNINHGTSSTTPKACCLRNRAIRSQTESPQGSGLGDHGSGQLCRQASRTESLGTRLKQLRGAEARRPSSHREPKRGCALHHDPVPPHPFMNSHMWKSDIMPLLEHAGGARERQKGPLGVASTVCS